MPNDEAERRSRKLQQTTPATENSHGSKASAPATWLGGKCMELPKVVINHIFRLLVILGSLAKYLFSLLRNSGPKRFAQFTLCNVAMLLPQSVQAGDFLMRQKLPNPVHSVPQLGFGVSVEGFNVPGLRKPTRQLQNDRTVQVLAVPDSLPVKYEKTNTPRNDAAKDSEESFGEWALGVIWHVALFFFGVWLGFKIFDCWLMAKYGYRLT